MAEGVVEPEPGIPATKRCPAWPPATPDQCGMTDPPALCSDVPADAATVTPTSMSCPNGLAMHILSLDPATGKYGPGRFVGPDVTVMCDDGKWSQWGSINARQNDNGSLKKTEEGNVFARGSFSILSDGELFLQAPSHLCQRLNKI
ncbi:hypothetical protein PRIPAC_84537 [Pristionchus pacificus]|uniref:Uncharacterized protein n=1 Tax=Pristionchus pacificus TaxID=54126 RepID=A0A2A6BLV1_PRIPA|nr:hypothetical protein PRIPAC_84537 [Pristionchus pacificus]|eukprot:PDM66900.1 hypothetical protein PRIPAC_48317 [Pristionchus pacificus]